MSASSFPRRFWRAFKIFIWAHVGLFFVLSAGLVLGGQRFLMYHPVSGGKQTPGSVGLHFEQVQLPTADGQQLRAWFVDAPETDRTIIYCYGNAGNLSNRVKILQILSGLGVDLLFFDYRGFGESTGSPTEAGTYADATAAWAYLRDTRGRSPSDILVYGRSMGGPIAAHLAAQMQPAGLVIDSTFESIPRLVEDTYPRFLYVPSLLDYDYPTRAYVQRFDGPVLVAHSRQDTVVPYAHGQALAAVAGRAEFLELQGGHGNGPFVTGDAYLEGLASFTSQIWPELKETLPRR